MTVQDTSIYIKTLHFIKLICSIIYEIRTVDQLKMRSLPTSKSFVSKSLTTMLKSSVTIINFLCVFLLLVMDMEDFFSDDVKKSNCRKI